MIGPSPVTRRSAVNELETNNRISPGLSPVVVDHELLHNAPVDQSTGYEDSNLLDQSRLVDLSISIKQVCDVAEAV